MTLLARVRSFCSALLRRRRVEREMEQEWQFHLDARVDALVASGVPRDEAEQRARREFGDPLRWTEQAREARGLGLLQDVGADVRYALRQVRRAPVFAAIVVTTLALAIGASLAIFALIDRVVLRPIDVPDASRLVMVQRTVQLLGIEQRRTDWPWYQYERLRDATTLDAVAASSPELDELSVSLDGSAPIEILSATFVSASYFRIFGAPPAAGRDFLAPDDEAGAPLVGMLGYDVWRTRYGGDAGVIGRPIRIGEHSVTIVGVAPPGLPRARVGAPVPDLVLPLTAAPHLLTGRMSVGVITDTGPARSPFGPIANLTVVGRMQPGASVAQVQAEIAGLLAGAPRMAVLPMREALLPFESHADLVLFLLLLAGAVGLTMGIGAINVAGLMLAHVEERRPELAIRAALGAGRVRLARQLAVEVTLLAVAGGAAALLVARWIGDGFSAFALPGGIAVDSVRGGLDARTTIFAVAVTAMVAFAISLAPALWGARRNLALEARRSGAAPEVGAKRVLLGLQIALCVVLVFGTGLFVRSLADALSTDPGFDARGLVSTPLRPPPPATRFGADGVRALGALLDRVREMPGVVAATVGPLPLVQAGDFSTATVEIDGAPVDSPIPLEVLFVGTDYFTTLGQPILRGRDFTTVDAAMSLAVAVVNESAARLLWGNRDAMGGRIGLPLFGETRDLSVIGIVRDAKLRTLDEGGRPAVYLIRSPHPSTLSALDAARGEVFLILRAGEGRALPVAAVVTRAAADAGLAVSAVTTVEEAIGGLLMPQRLGRALLAGLSLVALAVTLVGVYGFVSGLVLRRTKEIGVRLALGASSPEVLYEAVRPTLVLVAAGLAAGAAAAWWSGRFADRFLHGISPSDPATLLTAVVLLGITAALAAIVPALRVLRIDPVDVLRAE